MYNCLSALSQVTGKIVDKTNFALEYATAAIYNQETNELVTGVITDINGVFVFDNLKKGTYYLEAFKKCRKQVGNLKSIKSKNR